MNTEQHLADNETHLLELQDHGQRDHELHHLPHQETCGVACGHNHAAELVDDPRDHGHEHHDHDHGTHPEGCGCVEHSQAAHEVDRGTDCDHTENCGHVHHHEAATLVDKPQEVKESPKAEHPTEHKHDHDHEHVHGPGCGHVEHEAATKFVDSSAESRVNEAERINAVRDRLAQEAANEAAVQQEATPSKAETTQESSSKPMASEQAAAAEQTVRQETPAEKVTKQEQVLPATQNSEVINQHEAEASAQDKLDVQEPVIEPKMNNESTSTAPSAESAMESITESSTDVQATEMVQEFTSEQASALEYEEPEAETSIVGSSDASELAATPAVDQSEVLEPIYVQLPESGLDDLKDSSAETIESANDYIELPLNPTENVQELPQNTHAIEQSDTAVETMLEDIPAPVVERLLTTFAVENVTELQQVAKAEVIESILQLPVDRQEELLNEMRALMQSENSFKRERLLEAIVAGLLQDQRSTSLYHTAASDYDPKVSRLGSILLKIALSPAA